MLNHWCDVQIQAFPELTAGLGTAFYSQQDIQQLVQYAYLRGVRIVPQVPMPGHTVGIF